MRSNPARLAELRRLLVLDSSEEQAYTDITTMLADGLGVPITMINLLDSERDWFKACVGLGHRESPAETSFCEVFFESPEDVILVEDTAQDARFSRHPLVIGVAHIRFYAAARLVVRGQTVGTLCAYDLKPRKVSIEQVEHLRSLASAAIELLAQRAEVA